MTDLAAAAPVRSVVLREWREGWAVVLAGLCGTAMCGLAFMPLGAFMAPLEQAFGWSRSEFSIGISICSAMGVILPPLVGMLIDRYGPRAVAVAGALLAGAMYSLFATVTGSLANWIFLWVLYGSAIALLMYGLWATAVAAAFVAGRGLAMSIALSGSALIGVIAPTVANWLIEHYGFRVAFASMGIIPGAIVALVCWFALARARRPAVVAGSASSGGTATGASLREAVTSVVFIKLMVMAVIINTALLAIPLHLISILGASGLERDAAVKVAGLFAFAAIIGKLSAGSVLDAFAGRLVLAIFITMLAASLALFAITDPPIGWSIVAVLLGGFCFGGITPIFPYLISRYFGLRSFGRLSGMIFSGLAFGAIAGPLVAAFVYDLTQSYAPFLLGAIPGLALAIVLCMSLGQYPRFEPAAG